MRRDTEGGWAHPPPGCQIAQVSILSKMKALCPGPVSHADARLEQEA